MNTYLVDNNAVGETEATLFEVLQPGATNLLVTLQNVGINTINYRFQQTLDGGLTWTDMSLLGTDYYNTLVSTQVRAFAVASLNSRVRCVGNASGGAILQFSVTRYAARSSGGSIVFTI